MFAPAWMLFKGLFLGPLSAILGWVAADWRRLAAVLVVLAIVATYVVADHRRAAADAIETQAKLDKLSHDFIAAADKARDDETKRQAQVAADITAAFQRQQAARDAAAAATDAQLEKEIAAHDAQLSAADRSCLVDDSNLDWLRPHAQPPATGRRH